MAHEICGEPSTEHISRQPQSCAHFLVWLQAVAWNMYGWASVSHVAYSSLPWSLRINSNEPNQTNGKVNWSSLKNSGSLCF